MTNELATIPPLREALALAVESGDIEGMKDVRAMASALQKGAKARGMGIESENVAAEVVLRAERAIGQTLIRMADEGLRATEAGNQRKVIGKIGTPEVRLVKEVELPTLADLGVKRHDSYNFQQLARLPDEVFERMLNQARHASERIAKVNFYRKPKDPKKEGPATKDESGFDEFVRGVHALLGWQVGDDGVGHVTRNALLLLPNDQLAELARLVQGLVVAYQEAKAQR